MANSYVELQGKAGKYFQSRLIKVTFTWLSIADGSYTETTDGYFCGRIVRLVTDPGATAPTDNYDVYLTDSDGGQIIGTQGENRDTATTEGINITAPGGYFAGTLTLTIAAAGAAKIGTVYVWIAPA